jgi:antitoxin PrlF
MALMKSRMTSKGQVTIPAEIRQELGLKPRDTVEFARDGERIFIKPMESQLLQSYRSIPALDPPMTDRELREAFEQDVADEVASEL